MKFLKKNIKMTKKVAVTFFSLSILIMVLSYAMTQSLLTKIELEDFTEEIRNDTKENVVAAKNLLDGMVADLENTASTIQKYDDLFQPQVKNILEFANKMDLFDVTFVADKDGNAISSNGEKFSVADQEYFHRALEGNVVFSEVLPSKQFKAIQIIALPIYTETKELKGVIFGLFNIETFSRLINTVVDNEKYVYIVDSNGTYINCFDTEHKMPEHDNFWEDLKLRKFHDITINDIKNDFSNRKDGDFSYEYKGTERYGCHMPLGIEDWQIVLTVEDTIMNSHIHSIRNIDVLDTIVNAICLTVMLLCVYFYFKKANIEIKNANKIISKNNEMMQMAVELTNHIIFEYDINEKKIELKTKFDVAIFKSKVISPVPKCFIDKNLVADDSVSEMKKLFETIKTEKSSQAEIQMIRNNQEKIWYRISMHNIYDEKGEIVGTVGSAEDINMLKKGEEAIKRKEEIHKSLIANALLYSRINLDTEKVIEINGKEAQIPYQDYLNNNIVNFVSTEHHSYVAKALSIEKLREDYQQGKEYIEIQYIMDNGQEYKWVSCLVYRIHMSDSSRVIFLVRDIDEQKRKEIALKRRAERDGLTELYNGVTTRSKINKVLQSKESTEGNHIFILLDLDNFKNINDTFGHAYGDQVLMDVANALNERLRSSDIVGRLGGDEFAIMIRNVRSDKNLDSIMKSLSSYLTKTYIQDDISVEVSVSMGVAIAPNDGTTFEELYQKADTALYQVKREGKNGYKRWK